LGTVPGSTGNVVIPAGVVRYPTVFTSTEIKSILIQNGASINVVAGSELKRNGH
jgi:hypothetical protein